MNRPLQLFRIAIASAIHRLGQRGILPVLALLVLAESTATAAPQDGSLRLELTTAYNFIVDSNVESPSTCAPRAASVSARLWNDGTTPITNLTAYIGDPIANSSSLSPSCPRSPLVVISAKFSWRQPNFVWIAPACRRDCYREGTVLSLS